MNDCRSCPSYMTGTDAAKYIGKDPGVPVCVRFGHLLAKHGMTPSQAERTSQTMAEGCSDFGNPAPDTKPDFVTASVAMPLGGLPAAVNGISTRAECIDTARVSGYEMPDAPASCAKCVNFISPGTVQSELGWKAGLCAAKGRLVFPNRYGREAVECEYGIEGEPRDTTEGIVEMPQYNTAFTVTQGTNPVTSYLVNGGKWIEPGDYESDKPVDADEADLGIRAWRLIPNPSSSTTERVYLPIFDLEVFDEKDRVKVPMTGDDEHPEWFVDHGALVYSIAAEWMGLDETPLLHGKAGVGKTEVFRHLAWMMQVPFDRISITRTTEIDDLAGHTFFEDGQTKWIDGRLSERWERVGVVVVDEFNCGPDEVDQFLRPLTDNSKQLVLDMNKGQRKNRNPFCFLGFTQNPAWDPMNVGTNEMADAAGNRLAHIYVDLPPEEIERAILVRRCEGDGYMPDGETLDKVMSIAKEIRANIDAGALPLSWGLRPQIAVIRKTRFYDLVTAYRRAVVDRLEPETGQQILDIVTPMADQGAIGA